MKVRIGIALAIALAGCGQQQGVKDAQDIQEAVRNSLKDPSSAKFGKLTLVGNDYACQSVNAKNSFGGYTGDQQAVVVLMNGRWHSLAIKNVSHEACLAVVDQVRRDNATKGR